MADRVRDLVAERGRLRFIVLNNVEGYNGGYPDPRAVWSSWGSLTPAPLDVEVVPLSMVLLELDGYGVTADIGLDGENWSFSLDEPEDRVRFSKMVAKAIRLALDSQNVGAKPLNTLWAEGKAPIIATRVTGGKAEYYRLDTLLEELIDGYMEGRYGLKPVETIWVLRGEGPEDEEICVVLAPAPEDDRVVGETARKAIESMKKQYPVLAIAATNPKTLHCINNISKPGAEACPSL